jgi:hypothetical protein
MLGTLFLLEQKSLGFAISRRRHHATTQIRVGGGGNQDDAFSDLTSSLARLDKQFEIKEATRKGKSRWSKLYLPTDNDDSEDIEEVNVGDDMYSLPKVPSNDDYVWILEPPDKTTVPSCVVVFTGGAGLGQFPHIAYNELLTRLSNRLNALCITAPYSVGLDHFELAKTSGEKVRRALIYLEDDPNRSYSVSTSKVYSLGHSLGCKLQTIYMLATGQTFDKIGFMAFNNFSFAATMKMAKAFAKELRQSTSRSRGIYNTESSSSSDDMISGLLYFAELAVGAIGIDFSPSSQDTDRLIQLRYNDELQSKTGVFVFDDDNLDSSREFIGACSSGSSSSSSSSSSSGPSLYGLPGGHLTPVYFQSSINDLEDIPPEAREMAKEAMGGFQGASFGDEGQLNSLVDAVCDWIAGKPAERKPIWARNPGEIRLLHY